MKSPSLELELELELLRRHRSIYAFLKLSEPLHKSLPLLLGELVALVIMGRNTLLIKGGERSEISSIVVIRNANSCSFMISDVELESGIEREVEHDFLQVLLTLQRAC